MTPSFCWVFLLALVGRARSVPDPIVVDACALLCNPGAETESERARDKTLYPRYPKVNCHPQSVSDDDQAWRIASHCLKLCNEELSVESEVNCFALRSSLGSNLGCFCEALTPLSPNTMRLHESWRLNFLVKELAKDIMTVILDSPLDMMILCEIHSEIYNNYALSLPENGQIIDLCKNETLKLRSVRSVDEDLVEEDNVLDKDAIEEIIVDVEDKDRVVREIKNLERSKENDDKHSKNSINELETEKNKDQKEDVTVDSEKDKVKDNTKRDTKHKEDSKNNNKRDTANDNTKNKVENNEENATNNPKNKVKNNEENATNNAKDNVENTMNSKTNNVENSKNKAGDNAKNDKKDSKDDSKKSKPTDQAENAKNDKERDKRDTYYHTDSMDYKLDYDEHEMMNDQATNNEPQTKVTTKEVLLELVKTTNHLVEVLNTLLLKLDKINFDFLSNSKKKN